MDIFLTELCCADLKVQSEAFNAILEVIRAYGSPEESQEDLSSFFPCDILARLIEVIFSADASKRVVILDGLLGKAMKRYPDLAYYTLREFSKMVPTMDSIVACRVLDIVLDAHNDKDSSDFLVQSLQGKMCVRTSGTFKKQYSTLLVSLLPLLSPMKVRKFLAFMDTRVLPYMEQPILLSNFLTQAYHGGGLNGVLALNALFILIRDHNLDFPDFYDYLYALLDEKLLTAPYRNRFLKIFSTLMSSTMLPSYTIAAMVKRFSRLSLAAPPSALVWILSFIYNMLREYPSCRVLIHRSELVLPNSDPYDPMASSIATCNALNSSLWEIAGLQSHYWSRISKLASLLQDKFTKPPYNLQEIAEEMSGITFLNSASAELSHLWTKRPPTQTEISNIMF